MGTDLSVISLAIVFLIQGKIECGFEGVRVLESDRSYVEQKLGVGVKTDDGDFEYQTDSYRVRVLYSAAPCSAPDTVTGGYSVKKDTVLRYEVRPRKRIKLDDLEWDRNQYKKVSDEHMVGFYDYTNEKKGILIVTETRSEEGSETIRAIYFRRAAEKEKRFKCPSN